MKFKKIFFTIVIFVVVIAGLVAIADRVSKAQTRSDYPGISARLDEIAAGQKAILQDLAAIKEKLSVLTIRVTQQQ